MLEKKSVLGVFFIAGMILILSPASLVFAQNDTLYFTPDHGFYGSPFELTIESANPGSYIYYTTDGSAPDITNAILYTAPLAISTTTVVRAVCITNNQVTSSISTQTYIFPDDVINQPADPPDYPSDWGFFLSINGIAPADYEMDPEMVADPEFAVLLREALLDLPVVSLVTDKDFLFSKRYDPDTGGIYIYTGTAGGTGYGWERPVSFEYFDAYDSVSLQMNCGIRIHGGEGRRPEKSPKHSFRLIFRSEYGPSKLNFPLFGNHADSSFDNIILRAGFGNTWIHWSHSERSKAQYLRDRWTKDTQLAMGHCSSNGIYVHLYINGLYWGIYNPSERMDSDFAESYYGGDNSDYDVIKDYTEAVDGYLTAWNSAITLANAGLAGDAAYQRLRGNNPDGSRNPAYEPLVDVISLADYMILNFYGGNWDWDHHNWVAIRNRVNPGKGFKFFCWDAEHMLEKVNANILSENNDKCPSRIFQQLSRNAGFRRLFADRVQKHCFNGGVLTPVSASERWKIRADGIARAIIAESARWGDYRRDVHQWQTAGPFELYTKADHWLSQMDFLVNTYFPDRTNNFINDLRKAGLFPEVNSPVLLIDGKPFIQRYIEPGTVLSMITGEGKIYYTTDGSDPVIWNTTPVISPSARLYSNPLVINNSCHIKARTYHNNVWSATTDQYFIFPDDYHDLRITEIHYHPLDESITDDREFEFIELKNTGRGTLDLGGLRFGDAIEYIFPSEVHLGPGEFIVLASDSRKFYERYGFPAYDEYNGQLDNSGEMILMITQDNDTICSILYEDSNGWPESADGTGKSLVPVVVNPDENQNSAEFWRESYLIGGSPGTDDIYVLLTGTTSKIATIYQNYPNPFSDATTIHYRLNEDAHVRLSITDITGKPLMELEDTFKAAGYYKVEWIGFRNTNYFGNGIYFCRLVVKNKKITNTLMRKILYIR